MAISSNINSDIQSLADDPVLQKMVQALSFERNIGFQSKTEELFYRTAWIDLQTAYNQPIVAMFYEWISFNLPSAVYTPDFMVIFKDSTIAFVEVKGSKKQIHYQISRYKVRIAASLNPFFRFAIATPVPRSNVWDIDKIPPDKRLSAFILNLTLNQEFNKRGHNVKNK